MILSIPNKKKFIQHFLSPVLILNPICSLSIEKDSLSCICSSIQNTLALSVKCACTSEGSALISLPDIKRLVTALDSTKPQDISLKINENNIQYNDGEQKFKYHLIENDLVKKVTINVDKVKNMSADTKFNVSDVHISSIFQGMSFTPDTNKVYIFTEEGKVKLEIGDRTRDNTDNFVTTLSDSFEGKEITKPIPFSIDTFNLVSFDKKTISQWRVNHQYSVITIIIDVDAFNLTYVFSALSN
jgi:hypothetical protein